MTKEELTLALAGCGYVASPRIVTTVLNALQLSLPILVEGEPGVGKTELAKACAKALSLPFLRVQFYEGIDNKDILYEYDYARQMLTTVALQQAIKDNTAHMSLKEAEKTIAKEINLFDESYLIERPLLSAINGREKKVLLLDEIDKTTEETEYTLLELLSDFSLSIPELGKTVTCPESMRPLVFLTSNNARELSDALRRRCLYLYLAPKTKEELTNIIRMKAGVPEGFAASVASLILEIRELSLTQRPSAAEAISWAKILLSQFGDCVPERSALLDSLGCIAKTKKDEETIADFLSSESS